jgi:hypothetical protein
MPNPNTTFDPESFVRDAYAIAERMDLEGWKSLFNDDGIFVAESPRITDCFPEDARIGLRRLWQLPGGKSG